MTNAYDLTKVSYKVVAVLKDGTMLTLTDVCEAIGWEENEGEYAARLNLTVRDVPYNGGRLAKAIPLCTVIHLYANWGEGDKKVWQGTVWEWSHSGIKKDTIMLTCYDMLFAMQKTQVNVYFPKNTSTRTIIKNVLGKWKIPIKTYKGPKKKHKKKLFNGKTVAAIIGEILEDAVDLGAEECIVRAVEGKVHILPRGDNVETLELSADQNLVSASDSFSMTDLVTRVIITGRSDRKGRPKVSAKVNGKTEYGILQTMQSKGSGSIKDAKQAANRTLRKLGKPKRTTTLVSADMPALRKGDQVYLNAQSLKGYFYVKGIVHDASAGQMKLEVEPV